VTAHSHLAEAPNQGPGMRASRLKENWSSDARLISTLYTLPASLRTVGTQNASLTKYRSHRWQWESMREYRGGKNSF
jgi:hypothetical protein